MKKEELFVLTLPASHGAVIGDHEFAHCGSLRLIDLPPGIERIEDYAFYRCTQLREIRLYAGLQRLGCGAFMGCRKVEKIVVRDITDDLHFLSELLYDLQYEVEAELHYRNGDCAKLLFPEYYEEAVENTPARIVNVVFHGTGYKYRQCFRNRQLDYEKYDRLFSYAAAQEFTPTCLRLSLNRLMTPVGLRKQAKEQYLSYLRKHSAEMAKMLCQADEAHTVRQLMAQGYFTEELLEEFQRQAAAYGRAEIAACLLDYRRGHFLRQKKTFDFDA